MKITATLVEVSCHSEELDTDFTLAFRAAPSTSPIDSEAAESLTQDQLRDDLLSDLLQTFRPLAVEAVQRLALSVATLYQAGLEKDLASVRKENAVSGSVNSASSNPVN